MTDFNSWFMTAQHEVRPSHLPTSADDKNLRPDSWFRRFVAIQPGTFVVPAPDAPAVYDPRPPVGLVRGELVGPRHYIGRVMEVERRTVVLTLWEIPNGREVFANVTPDAVLVTVNGELSRGLPVDLWTWTQYRDSEPEERLHLQPIHMRLRVKKRRD